MFPWGGVGRFRNHSPTMPSSECSRFTTKVRITGDHLLLRIVAFPSGAPALSSSRNITHSVNESKTALESETMMG